MLGLEVMEQLLKLEGVAVAREDERGVEGVRECEVELLPRVQRVQLLVQVKLGLRLLRVQSACCCWGQGGLCWGGCHMDVRLLARRDVRLGILDV